MFSDELCERVNIGSRNTLLCFYYVSRFKKEKGDKDLAAVKTHLFNQNRCEPPLPKEEVNVIIRSLEKKINDRTR